MSANDLAIVSVGTPWGASRGPLGAETAPKRAPAWPATTDPRVRCLEALIRRDLHRRMRLAELAAIMRISASRLSHLFSAHTGVSPGQYLKAVRLRQARAFLEGSPLSVKEVAARVGLNPSRFAREFRQRHGMTPRQYRLLHQDVNRLLAIAGSDHK